MNCQYCGKPEPKEANKNKRFWKRHNAKLCQKKTFVPVGVKSVEDEQEISDEQLDRAW